VVYVARPGFERMSDRHPDRAPTSATIRIERLPVTAVEVNDPTGCGDVFGATCFARLLAGDDVIGALQAANQAGARNATFRGASGLAHHLRGGLVPA
jgi:sugar/nucleoside kinase (ribokinase family)